MTTIHEKNLGAHSDDLDEVLMRIEKSYDIRFGEYELKDVRTFGELCDIIINKIKLQDTDDCTTQQAFYKLRDAIIIVKQLDNSSIQTNTPLSSIFPRHRRRKQISEVEKVLGFKVNALRPKHFITGTLVFILLASLPTLYFSWQYGLSGLVLSILLLFVANKTGKEFNEKTVGELAEKMTRENYVKARRNSLTINKAEIPKQIEKLFITDLGLSDEKISRDTLLI